MIEICRETPIDEAYDFGSLVGVEFSHRVGDGIRFVDLFRLIIARNLPRERHVSQ
jgi:hypothetical protein